MDKPIIKAAAAVLMLTAAGTANASENNAGVNTGATTTSTKYITTGQAHGGHESVEALKAEVTALKGQLSNANTGREYLLVRLREVLAENERALKGREFLSAQSKRYRNKLMAEREENAKLKTQLNSAVTGRDYLKRRAEELIERAKAAESEADQIAEVSFTQINSAMAEASDAKKMLSSVTESQNDKLELALRGRRFLGAESERNRKMLMAEQEETARLRAQLASVTTGRDHLRAKLSNSVCRLKPQRLKQTR